VILKLRINEDIFVFNHMTQHPHKTIGSMCVQKGDVLPARLSHKSNLGLTGPSMAFMYLRRSIQINTGAHIEPAVPP